MRIFLILPLVAAFIFFLFSEQIMAFGKTKVFASAMEGRLMSDETTPAAGVRVTRRWVWNWNSDEGIDETVTDADGRFTFGTVTGGSLMGGLLPHEPNVTQEFYAYPDGKEVLILDLRKRSYEIDGELEGKKLKINCRTDTEADANGLFWGTCVYDG